ncbi:MAG: hypothetical protein M1828_004350 [Chrysothrix sp. TS-e1954]|nr:MAG: hypothetical protein M1828_004350 [Chrysothrix sp. TS-e1954]
MEAFPPVTNGSDSDRFEIARSRHRSNGSWSAASSGHREHKRTHSVGLLSRLAFFRSQNPEDRSSKPAPLDSFPSLDEDHAESTASNPVISNDSGTQNQTRKRKGSLRKTALLGTGFLKMDRRSSDPTSPKRSPGSKKSPSKFAFEIPAANSSTDSDRCTEKLNSSVATKRPPTLTSPVTSPTGTITSNTDEDEALMLPIRSFPTTLSNNIKSPSASPSPPSSESSGQIPSHSIRRHSLGKTKSPLAAPQISELSAIEEDWDYSETEWWGWAVLAVTWIVFVVGMGSCLEVWSWAWDVGQTPYAPPELEDDPTLPIVGYYPALIILTAVMSWVWVVVSWVGMKYFKHAKIQADET